MGKLTHTEQCASCILCKIRDYLTRLNIDDCSFTENRTAKIQLKIILTYYNLKKVYYHRPHMPT